MKKSGIDTFGNQAAVEFSLDSLRLILAEKGISKLYSKCLSGNDNSKNQIYLGGDFSSLNIIPVKSLELSDSTSGKPGVKSGGTLIQGAVQFSWIDTNGQLYPAPGAKLILYPQYPEVRFSGFLKGSGVNASEWMDSGKQGRAQGRHLLFGIHPDGHCIGYIAVPGSRIAKELNERYCEGDALLADIGLHPPSGYDSRNKLLSELLRIYRASPIDGKKFDRKTGAAKPYKAANGAGYTLEAELGISPNGYAEPDYEGWEVKAHGGSVVTLMTPAPSGGIYKNQGIEFFVRQYGYPDRNGKPDRLNFGGIHRIGERQSLTGLTMTFKGYTPGSDKMDATGGLYLVDDNDLIAAEWSFSKLLEHWNKKHSKAVYVPYRAEPFNAINRYYFGNTVSLGEGTDFFRFLKALSLKSIYFDPGIKLVGFSTKKPKIKPRSQFRIKFSNIGTLYQSWENINLSESNPRTTA